MGGTDKYHRLATNEGDTLYLFLYHYYIGGIILVSYLYHLKEKSVEEMKEDFTHNITHELKTPIAVAYAANDALLNFNGAENLTKRQNYLQIIQTQLKQLSGLVEQILSMSMEQRKNFRLNYEPVELRPMLEI